MDFQLSKLVIFENEFKVMLFLNDSQNGHELRTYDFIKKRWY